MRKDKKYVEKVLNGLEKVVNTKEYKEIKRQETKARWEDKNSVYHTKKYRENLLKSFTLERRKQQRLTGKNNWKDPLRVKKMLKSFDRRPTNPEKIFNESTPDIVRYVGNGTWWRYIKNGKNRYGRNPDFKVTGQNKVIEIYGDYWHRNDDPEELIQEYKSVGLDCLVFWEHEIYDDLDNVLEQVNEFIGKEILV